MVTSGSYEKFAEVDGVRYSHIINPKTGLPAVGLISVTVVGPSAEFANALSTSIMVLGKKEGLKLLKKYRASLRHSRSLLYRSARMISLFGWRMVIGERV